MIPPEKTDSSTHPSDDAASLSCSIPGPDDDLHSPCASSLPRLLDVLMDQNSDMSPNHALSQRDGGGNLVQSPDSDHSSLSFPPTDVDFVSEERAEFASLPLTCNPSPTTIPPSCQVSVIIPSPGLCPSPLALQCPEDPCPDLECSICFSEFNNVFRCPKMLHCKHTFCLECLARINVKSVDPNAIPCPLCRSLTPLPSPGLPRLPTDSNILSYFPAAMQRVYSIRFLRNKGKLEVKRSSEGHQRWARRASRLTNNTLDVGLPSPPVQVHGRPSGFSNALFRLTSRPLCRVLLLVSVLTMMVLLTGIVIFLLLFQN